MCRLQIGISRSYAIQKIQIKYQYILNVLLRFKKEEIEVVFWNFRKSAKPEEPSTNSDTHSLKKEEESQKVIVPSPTPAKPIDQEMLQQIQNINDLRNRGLYEKSVQHEYDYITQLINKENIQQQFALEYKWAVNYTNHLKGKKTEIKSIDNQKLVGSNKVIRSGLALDKDYVALNESAWNFVMQMYGGGPEVKLPTIIKRESNVQPNSNSNTNIKPPKQPQTMIQTQNHSRFIEQKPMNQTVSVMTTPKSVDRQITSIIQSHPRNDSAQNYRRQQLEQQRTLITQGQLPIIGLKNPRYYCYLNSALQVLLSIDSLTEGILAIQPKYGQKFLSAFQELLRAIKRQNSFSAIAAQGVWEICSGKFQIIQQQDSHEFLLFFLGKIQEELVGKYKNKQEFNSAEQAWNDYKFKNQDIIDIIFAGQSTSQSFCKSCNQICEGYDPIWDLSLPISKSYTGIDLMDCLKQQYREEVINDTWKCDKCKKTNKSVKRKMFISQTPQYLIIQFKRFTSFPTSQKINDSISYPEKLDIQEFCSKGLQTKYKLKALITHMGQINGGHYKAYAERYDNWYQFDDEIVTKINGKQLSDRSVYVLLYEKY
ncbi:unnamed protein product [Paramecium sonneborni]|uniref:Ubiquitinyl hydrolase 1 n=1 Tax=Paramecium sonneborni TaxID=65129 RepID=A0A8S1KIP9_9CILI|nr:unnamed protein product [Paramecium sonneborni]